MILTQQLHTFYTWLYIGGTAPHILNLVLQYRYIFTYPGPASRCKCAAALSALQTVYAQLLPGTTSLVIKKATKIMVMKMARLSHAHHRYTGEREAKLHSFLTSALV
jgi:hypothetical protein